MSETEPIIKVAFFKFKEAWYRLSPEERTEMGDNVIAKLKELDIKTSFWCNCYWSNEEWPWFSVEVYPDVEAVKKIEDYIFSELGWQRYAESKLYLGTQETVETGLKMFVRPQI